MNDQTKIGNLTAAQVTAAQATAAQAGAAIDQPKSNYWRDLVLDLETLLHANGRIELVINHDGSIDVRCNGLATYGRGLASVLRERLDVESARVTDKLMGTGAGVIAGAGNIANKL